MTDTTEVRLGANRKVNWDFTFAFLALRLWLGVRALFVGIQKFAAYKSVAMPLIDPSTGQPDASGVMVNVNVKSYALANYAGIPVALRDKFAQEPLFPKFVLTAFDKMLGPAFILDVYKRQECMAKEILTDDRGRARGVAYFDADGRLQEQPCDIVIVSACAIESARLLLNSKSRLFPNGIGNRHDQVGRHLQGHHYTGAVGFFDFDTYDDVGPGASIAVADYNHGTPGLCGGGALCNEFIRLPIQMIDRLPVNTPRWGLAHKKAMRSFYKRNIAVMGPTQPIPMADARITLDPAVRDKWGMQVARISGNVHPHTFEIGIVQAQRSEAWLKEAGAVSTVVNAGRPTTVSAGQHQAGTCRMGNDPQGSVVNRNCQVHDVDNLFVIDGSVHVTNGGFNPALTIMALSLIHI